MKKETVLLVSLLGLVVLCPLWLDASPKAQSVDQPNFKFGGLALPYRGEANLSVSALQDEDGNVEEVLLAFSVPAPANFSCKNIGWEFAILSAPQSLDLTKELDLSGETSVWMIDNKLHIEIIDGKTGHNFVIPWNAAFAYDGNEFVQDRNGNLIQTKAEELGPQTENSECPGGSCNCGQGNCTACCSAGYHPACKNCDRHSESCTCYRNRTNPQAVVVVEEYAPSPT